MMRYLLLCLVLCSFAASAQKPFLRDLSLNETGTPVKVNALARDRTGYLWLATDEGVYTYNGQSFARITDSTHLPVTAICSRGNDVYAAYANGSISRLVNGAMQRMHITGRPTATITSIRADSTGMLWLTTEDQGIFCIIRNIAVALTEANGLLDNFTYSSYSLPGNRIITGCDKGINDITLLNGKPFVTPITTEQGLADNIVRVIKPIPSSTYFFIGTQEKGIALYNSATHTISQSSTAWPWGQVNDILPVDNDHAWVATEEGALVDVRIDHDSILSTTPYYYPGKKFRRLEIDNAGNIWCATSQGLSLFTAEYLYQVHLDAPYSLTEVTAMACDTAHTLWIALKHRLYSLALGSQAPTLTPVLDAGVDITSLYTQGDNTLWIGTWGKGLYRKKNNAAPTNLTHAQYPGNPNIININGTDSTLWVAGLEGVDEFLPEHDNMILLRHHGKNTGVGSDYVYQLYPDRKGNMWMATDGAGVCMYDGTTYHHWPSFSAAGSRVAYTLTEDMYGDMWAGTLYKDLYRFHNNSWNNLRLPETQYPDINISSVAANDKGQVISVYQRCIDEWYPKSHYFRHFNSAMGIGIDSTSSVLNCTARDKEGNIYIPFRSGILIFSQQDSTYDIRPQIKITRTSVNLQAVAADKHAFNYNENYLSFNFDGINYTNHERLNYRYTLQGYSNQWIKTRDASVTFPNLPPGNYTFRVQVSLNPYFNNAREDDYRFSIAAPFWRTWVFYFLAGLGCLAIAYAYITLRERNLKKIARLQQERMLFEYEHLKSQVNPHFLFNSLNTLTNLIEENASNAIDYTVHLSDLYRNMLTYRNKDLILLSEECEIMNNYIHVQRNRFGNAFDVQIDIPGTLMKTKKVVPLALQLLVENAIKHNVVSIAQPLIISITASEEQIVVSNRVQPRISPERSSGLGLANIRKRYGLLTKKQISWGIIDNEFVVTLPLL